MRILIANMNLVKPRGTEIWCWTIARELRARGHSVDLFTVNAGEFMQVAMTGYGIFDPATVYDLALVNHARSILKACGHNSPIAMRTVFISHGIGRIERPIRTDMEETIHVAVSQETARRWEKRVGRPLHIVPNPVAPEWFDVEPLAEDAPPTILWANHREKPPKGLRIAAKKRGYTIRDCYKTRFMPEAVISRIASVGLVIGTGRWVYEAMAAGRHVIVAARGKTCGYVSSPNYARLVAHNMTVRAIGARPIARGSEWDNELHGLEERVDLGIRRKAKRNHRVDVVVDRLLEIAS